MKNFIIYFIKDKNQFLIQPFNDQLTAFLRLQTHMYHIITDKSKSKMYFVRLLQKKKSIKTECLKV